MPTWLQYTVWPRHQKGLFGYASSVETHVGEYAGVAGRGCTLHVAPAIRRDQG